jgi:hypothetical protein
MEAGLAESFSCVRKDMPATTPQIIQAVANVHKGLSLSTLRAQLRNRDATRHCNIYWVSGSLLLEHCPRAVVLLILRRLRCVGHWKVDLHDRICWQLSKLSRLIVWRSEFDESEFDDHSDSDPDPLLPDMLDVQVNIPDDCHAQVSACVLQTLEEEVWAFPVRLVWNYIGYVGDKQCYAEELLLVRKGGDVSWASVSPLVGAIVAGAKHKRAPASDSTQLEKLLLDRRLLRIKGDLLSSFMAGAIVRFFL